MLRRAHQGEVTLADIARAARQLHVPVWALLVPGLHEQPELLCDGGLEGLEGVIKGYLAAGPDQRQEIEIVARRIAAASESERGESPT